MSFTRSLLAVFFMTIVFTGCQKKPSALSKAIDLSTFEIQEGFSIELIAAEPLVMDPVAMEIDENGTMYVVEMPGYPLDVTGTGRVKVLKDTDADGVIDEAILFADDLVLPTGIMRWKNGVIVTDAPDVIYLEDTDGDNRADKREVMLTGFSRSNPQHNMNTPKYGLDNWIYLGHEGAFITKAFEEEFGDVGEEIRFPNQPDAPMLAQNAGNKCVRFQPDHLRLEMLSGRTQFGYTFDDWGNLFYTGNAQHLFHEVIAARYLQGNRNLALTSTRNYLPDYGPGAEVYPITQDPQHQILTDVGVITSACGLTWYQGGTFPDSYDQVCFTAESVHNMIHTDVVLPKGASFVATRQFEKREFLASRDSWFRPVNFYIGPSGDLFVLDYYRQYIEHPEWMAQEVVESGALYNGHTMGRIYKISAVQDHGRNQSVASHFGQTLGEDLIPYLAHPNIWWRRTAQRLLVQNSTAGLEQPLVDFAMATSSAVGLVHAIWTLEGIGGFDVNVLEKALDHEVAGVRTNGIKIAELHLERRPSLVDLLIDLRDDPDPGVRFQLLCSSTLKDKELGTIREGLLFRDIDDDWVQTVALMGIEDEEEDIIQNIVRNAKPNQLDGIKSFVSKTAEMVGRKRIDADIKALIRMSTTPQAKGNAWWLVAIQSGLARGVSGRADWGAPFDVERVKLLSYFNATANPDLRRSSMDLLQRLRLPAAGMQQKLDLAQVAIGNRDYDAAFRIDAISLLSLDDAEKYVDQFTHLMTPIEPIEVQVAALNALQFIPYNSLALDQFVFDSWEEWTPMLRERAMALLMHREETMMGILTAVETGKIHRTNITWSNTSRLLNNRNDSIKQRARQLLAGDEMLKEDVFARYQAAIEETGDPVQGKQVFMRVCSACHQMAGKDGLDFGPDLAAIRNRTKTALLNDLLFPNLAIADGYAAWELSLKDGTVMVGVIADEVDANVMLKEATGTVTIIPRDNIESLNPTDVSAMPAGLDQQVTVEEMKNLLTFLKKPFW
ncbi:MAG: c-type cytochrome [Saprospiraceae bacterium]|nr:c-type cytochrome [Saprospiraceae bacterium]